MPSSAPNNPNHRAARGSNCFPLRPGARARRAREEAMPGFAPAAFPQNGEGRGRHDAKGRKVLVEGGFLTLIAAEPHGSVASGRAAVGT